MTLEVSYAQRLEDVYLARCFPDRKDGFYIDIGAGHPVYDNASFAFYLKGWRGVTVEPNPDLAQLARAVRPRDRCEQVLVGAEAGRAPFYRVHDFHGFSTTIEQHAQAALSQFGKSSERLELPMVTLAQLCERDVPGQYEFLKVDVEGSEADVLLNGDFARFRPNIIVVEALAPYSLAPTWDAWEPFLAKHGYRYVWFDTLNRYYLADEARELARHFQNVPDSFPGTLLYRDARPALDDASHLDHHLAQLMAQGAMTRLPLLERERLLDLATARLSPAELDRTAGAGDWAICFERLFGTAPTAADVAAHAIAPGATIRELYAHLIDGDRFRAACGRISAGYAW